MCSELKTIPHNEMKMRLAKASRNTFAAQHNQITMVYKMNCKRKQNDHMFSSPINNKLIKFYIKLLFDLFA